MKCEPKRGHCLEITSFGRHAPLGNLSEVVAAEMETLDEEAIGTTGVKGTVPPEAAHLHVQQATIRTSQEFRINRWHEGVDYKHLVLKTGLLRWARTMLSTFDLLQMVGKRSSKTNISPVIMSFSW